MPLKAQVLVYGSSRRLIGKTVLKIYLYKNLGVLVSRIFSKKIRPERFPKMRIAKIFNSSSQFLHYFQQEVEKES
jgi:hypothetical protein